MANIKIVMRPEEKPDGSFPLAIRVTRFRDSKYAYLDYTVDRDDWNEEAQEVKRSHPSHSKMNNYLLKRRKEAVDIALEMETLNQNVTAKAIADKIKGKGNSFFAQAEIHLDNLKKAKDFNRWTNETSLIKHFKEFVPRGDIEFARITPTLLKQFAAHLKASGDNISETHIMNHMVVIRLIFNQAIDCGLVDEKFYPFGRRKFRVKFPESIKVGLTAQEVKLLEDELLTLTDSRMVHALRLFLFSFYFAGMRISDVLRLRWSDFRDGRLYYVMGKNGKAGSLKVPEKAHALMQFYKRENPKHDLVFPDLESVANINDEWQVKRKIKSCIRRINEYLDLVKKEINKDEVKLTKKLDPHIARHTFGNIAGDKIALKTLQQLYRHFHLSTTAIYQQNFTYTQMDNALDAVLEEVGHALAA